jgi:hypothetical protein
VAEAMVEYLYHHNANTHWAYPTSAETDAALADARDVFAAFLNGHPDEIAFGANMTTLTMHLARALARTWAPGDELVVTELDHHANVDPWIEAARDRGLVVRRVRMLPESGTLDWDDLERQLSAKTRLLAIGAASNALGTITDRRPRPGSPMRWRRSSSWMACTTPPITCPTCGRSAAMGSPARPTSSTDPTSACCGSSATASRPPPFTD